MPTLSQELHKAQEKLEDMAKSIEWWMECDTCTNGTPTKERPFCRPWGHCPRCRGIGRILRYPHLFEAVFSANPLGGSMTIRPVMEFWWLVLNGNIEADGIEIRVESDGKAEVYAPTGGLENEEAGCITHRPALALIDVLVKTLVDS